MLQRQQDGHRSLIHRVLDVLGAFTPERSEMSLTNISRRTDLPLATVHRLVGELVEWGALQRGEDGCYRLSMKIWQLCTAAPGMDDLSRAAMPSLSDLYQLTERQAQLSILDGTDAVVIASIDGRPSLDHFEPRRRSAYLTGAGLVLLAHAPSHVQEKVITSRPLTCTANDRPSQNTLRRLLAEVRLRGLASCAYHEPGSSVIASGVRNSTSRMVAAVSVVVGGNVDIQHASVAVRAAAHEVSHRLGTQSGAPNQLSARGISMPVARALR